MSPIPMEDCIIASTAIINQAKILSYDIYLDNTKEVNLNGLETLERQCIL
ncbi:MAG: hypothetical protein QXR19_02325 [Candidatus Jordarchaeaceae archaeon]